MSIPDTQTPFPRRRVAVVVQRYGDDIAGGAEAHARQLIELIARHHDVTVLTSCAINSTTWALHWPPGTSQDRHAKVQRYSHPIRNADGRARVPRRHKLRFLLRTWLDLFGMARVLLPVGDDALDGVDFLRRQGPCCEELIQSLRDGRDCWDVVVFFTALYHPTAIGLPIWGGRSVLIPTLHDEKAMYLPVFHRVFSTAGEILWNTQAEQRLATRLYGPSTSKGIVVGTGVNRQIPDRRIQEETKIRHGIAGRFLVYVGRLESGKGCGELANAWSKIAHLFPDACLVLIGKGDWKPIEHPQIRCTGFVTDADRDALIAGALALVMPSRHESLSLVLLEAMALGVPVLANRHCEPLNDHVVASGAGSTYDSPAALRQGLKTALTRSPQERDKLGKRGQEYVQNFYSQDRVSSIWLNAIERVANQSA